MRALSRGKKRSKGLKSLVVFSVLCVVLYMVLNFTNDELEFHIQADTEFIRLSDISANSSNLVIRGAKVFRSFDEDPIVDNFNGEIDLVEGTIVDFERVSNGPLIISLYANPNASSASQSVGTLLDFNEENVVFDAQEKAKVGGQLDDGSTIIIDSFDEHLKDGQSFVFPFSSKISLGSKVYKAMPHQTNPVLRGGKIKVYGKTVWLKETFLGREVELQQGDQCYFPEVFPIFRIANPVSNSSMPAEMRAIERDKVALDIPVKQPGAKVFAYGFVSLSERPALSVSLTSINRAVMIKKIGPETSSSEGENANSPNYITISNFARYKADPIFQLLSLILGFVSTFIALFRLTKDTSSSRQKSS